MRSKHFPLMFDPYLWMKNLVLRENHWGCYSKIFICELRYPIPSQWSCSFAIRRIIRPFWMFTLINNLLYSTTSAHISTYGLLESLWTLIKVPSQKQISNIFVYLQYSALKWALNKLEYYLHRSPTNSQPRAWILNEARILAHLPSTLLCMY